MKNKTVTMMQYDSGYSWMYSAYYCNRPLFECSSDELHTKAKAHGFTNVKFMYANGNTKKVSL